MATVSTASPLLPPLTQISNSLSQINQSSVRIENQQALVAAYNAAIQARLRRDAMLAKLKANEREIVLCSERAEMLTLLSETLTEIQSSTISDRLRKRGTYVQPHELRELFGVEKATICAWVREGFFGNAVIRTGNKNVYDPWLLAEWLNQRTTALAPSKRKRDRPLKI